MVWPKAVFFRAAMNVLFPTRTNTIVWIASMLPTAEEEMIMRLNEIKELIVETEKIDR